MDDLISRQAAIDALTALANDLWNQSTITTWAGGFSEAADVIENIPSVQGGKEMTVKKLIEELEIQHEAWGKQYTFDMIIRDIEKYAEEEDHEADEGDR